jgi:hypothetical protein
MKINTLISTTAIALLSMLQGAVAQTASPKAEVTLYFQHYWPQTALTVKELVVPW